MPSNQVVKLTKSHCETKPILGKCIKYHRTKTLVTPKQLRSNSGAADSANPRSLLMLLERHVVLWSQEQLEPRDHSRTTTSHGCCLIVRQQPWIKWYPDVNKFNLRLFCCSPYYYFAIFYLYRGLVHLELKAHCFLRIDYSRASGTLQHRTVEHAVEMQWPTRMEVISSAVHVAAAAVAQMQYAEVGGKAAFATNPTVQLWRRIQQQLSPQTVLTYVNGG